MVTRAEWCHDAVKIVITVLALTHNREGEVHLSRSVNLNPVDAPSTNASATNRSLPRKCSHHARRARRRARDTAKFTKETHPAFDTERLCSKIRIRIRALKRLHDLVGRNRQCTWQRVAQLLPALPESGLDEPPELLLVIFRESSKRRVRQALKREHSRIHCRNWLKRFTTDQAHNRGLAPRSDKRGEIRPVANRCGNALRDLTLDEQDDSFCGVLK